MHDGIAGAGTATAIEVFIGAYDVDYPYEIDNIYGYDAEGNGGAGEWITLGNLTGTSDVFTFGMFNLSAALFNDVETGLKLWVDIDANDTFSWLLTLTKSVITTDGEDPGNPNPGRVPLPAAGLMLIAGLGGMAAMRRKNKA